MTNEFARHLRKNMTPQEVALWCQLRHLNKQGFHFRRQSPLANYVVDFLERKRRLVIEIDGSQHGLEKGARSDRLRDMLLQEWGYRVLRFWNVDVDHAMDGVIDKITEAITAPTRSLREHPPLKQGRD
ncbi:MAG: endonuclease domain-containing protein [Alphaproteobacteria bacterium]|nr:endonuclease domain-containing protein [Alphaproteobacteria bacterium]